MDIIEFNPRNRDICEWFEDSCTLYKKAVYGLTAFIPSSEEVVYNFLEDATYITDPSRKDVILTGKLGENWVISYDNFLRTYDVRSKIKFDTFLKVQTKKDSGIYAALRVPVTHIVAVKTAWGETLLANNPSVPHGLGDMIICRKKNGRLVSDDFWVVNGCIFDETYMELE